MSKYYVLEGQTPKKADAREWAQWFERAGEQRRVAHNSQDMVSVSTVFLGLDHQFGDGPPLLFETMIFGGEHDGWQDRCSTWDQALVMHCKACELAGVPYQQ